MAGPPFHFDAEHFPAAHPGAIDDCPDCRPAPPTVWQDSFRNGPGALWSLPSHMPIYVFDGRLADVLQLSGAATELDYYEGTTA
ncbi:hypothetical protein [Mycolicibacterium llatzerense]|uniref:Uncharacterized protein n=1 Tax=Mycolicibacterium llatzerense TaxID=280871 RepID=A0A0D1J8G8_9MYCO|nr:hypothetical protein [Mycolicibacterium llatzerense]KIU17893.1 hypothetical protein TL10_06455 [Mycolicibacterium llatzerense]